MAFSPCRQVLDVSPSSYEDTSYFGLGPILKTSLNLNYLLKGPILKYGNIMLRASTYEAREEGGCESAYNTWFPQNCTHLQLVSSMIFPQHDTLIMVDVADIFDIPHPYHPLAWNDSTHSVGPQSLVYIIQGLFSDRGWLAKGWNNLGQSGSSSFEGLKLGLQHLICCLKSLGIRVQAEAVMVRGPSSSTFKEKWKNLIFRERKKWVN